MGGEENVAQYTGYEGPWWMGEVVEISRMVRVDLLRSWHLSTDRKEVMAMRIFAGRGFQAEVQKALRQEHACHVEEQQGSHCGWRRVTQGTVAGEKARQPMGPDPCRALQAIVKALLAFTPRARVEETLKDFWVKKSHDLTVLKEPFRWQL